MSPAIPTHADLADLLVACEQAGLEATDEGAWVRVEHAGRSATIQRSPAGRWEVRVEGRSPSVHRTAAKALAAARYTLAKIAAEAFDAERAEVQRIIDLMHEQMQARTLDTTAALDAAKETQVEESRRREISKLFEASGIGAVWNYDGSFSVDWHSAKISGTVYSERRIYRPMESGWLKQGDVVTRSSEETVREIVDWLNKLARYEEGVRAASMLPRLTADDIPTEIKEATMRPTTTTTTLTDDAREAATRTAARQLVKLTREPLVGLLQRHLAPGDDAFRARLAAFLETELGTALLASLLSVGLGSIPSAPPQAGTLARELRVQGMALAGDTALDVLMGPLREVVRLYLQDTAGIVAALPSGEGVERLETEQVREAAR